ncbi:18665_t:CDS:2, partial [Racocetra fulgida]
EEVPMLENEPAITILSDEELNESEYVLQIDFSHLESIRGNHIFTRPIHSEMTQLCEIHTKLIKEMKKELESQNKKNQTVNKDNGIQELAQTITNPIGIKTKGRRSGKRIKAFNDTTNIMKGKKAKHLRIQEASNSTRNNMLYSGKSFMTVMSLLFDLSLFAYYLIIIFVESDVAVIEPMSNAEE